MKGKFFMTISAISFGSNALTDKGNDYNKTNTGKYVGTGLGATYASYNIYKNIKFKNLPMGEKIKQVEQMLDKVKTKAEKFGQFFDKSFKFDKKDMPNISKAEIQKLIEKNEKYFNLKLGRIFVVTSLMGLGLGAITDAIINNSRQKHADKLAEK